MKSPYSGPMGHTCKSVAVIERWLWLIEMYTVSQVTRVGGCNNKVAALLSDHCTCTEISLCTMSI